MTHSEGLAPHVFPGSRILILGSFPSRTALRTGGYYANPLNQFWNLLRESLEPRAKLKGEMEKLAFLERHGLALWNVVARCSREGSSDSAIRGAELNDVPGLLRTHPGIRKVLLNGRYPEKIWRSAFAPHTAVPAFYVPASSSQHARLGWKGKLSAWKRALRA